MTSYHVVSQLVEHIRVVLNMLDVLITTTLHPESSPSPVSTVGILQNSVIRTMQVIYAIGGLQPTGMLRSYLRRSSTHFGDFGEAMAQGE